MSSRISLVAHLSSHELEQRYRKAKNGVESRQFHIIWLLSEGRTTEEVVTLTGYSRNWIYRLVRLYNEQGTDALGDQRRHNQGAAPLLDDWQQSQLWQVLQGAAPDGGLWNGRKVADWLSELTGERIYRQRGWEILRQMTFRLRVPRPAHTEGDLEEQQAWKKT
jgi:transposase